MMDFLLFMMGAGLLLFGLGFMAGWVKNINKVMDLQAEVKRVKSPYARMDMDKDDGPEPEPRGGPEYEDGDSNGE